MAASLTGLMPQFIQGLSDLFIALQQRGVEMRANEALRSPLVQAKYWRQSRSREEIDAKVKELRKKKANYLADCIEAVGPQHGPDITGAIPGLSWHQWGEALDCFWVVDGKASWSTTRLVNGQNGYRIYASEAKNLGLDAGGFWKSRKDWPHVQLRAGSSPLVLYTLQEIDAQMALRFGPIGVSVPAAPSVVPVIIS